METERKNYENATEEQKNYSLHTFMMKRILTRGEQEIILKRFFESMHTDRTVRSYKEGCWNQCDYKRFFTSDQWAFNYVDIGERIINSSQKSYYIAVKINPRAILHKETYPYAYIASMEDISQSMRVFDRFWLELRLGKINHNSFYISRIDYCVNIMMKSREEVKTYMRLIQKGMYPLNGKRLLEWSESGRRYIPTKNSFTIRTKSLEFSIYDKYKQLKGEEEKYSKEEIDQAKNIIRIELRVHRSKVRYEEKKHAVDDTGEFLDYTSQIAKENIPRYLRAAYGKEARFVRYSDAILKVEESRLKKKSKDRLKNIIYFAVRNSLQSVKKLYTTEQWQRSMEQFTQLGISPITLPEHNEIKYMEHPLFYAENCCANNEFFLS